MVEVTTTPPGKDLLLLEWRALAELWGLAAVWPHLALITPRGDGHPVLVLPGLISDDKSTLSLRKFLKLKGYITYGWDMGVNRGPLPGMQDRLVERVEGLAEQHGQKISIIGWSLGGIYARQLGKLKPDLVRQVISLGSPFGGSPRATNAWRLYELASGQDSDHAASQDHLGGDLAATPSVRTTAIYSKHDGVCAWQNCIEENASNTENIEVYSSHCGLGHHPAVAYAIADRLAQPENDWTPFSPFEVFRFAFPLPSYRTA